MTLKKLKSFYKIKDLDFLKMDCESLDSKILLKSSYEDLKCRFLCVELLPQEVFGWKYKIPKKLPKNYYKNYFIKSKVYKKLNKNFVFAGNYNYAFLLKNKIKNP